MSVQESIEAKLTESFAPTVLVVQNESAMHKTPVGAETHFKALVVSQAFEGQSPLARHRAVYQTLGEALSTGLHALSVRALTPAQYAAGEAEGFVSPPCGVRPRAGSA